MKRKGKSAKRRAAAFGKSYANMRSALMKQLKGVDANILVSVVKQGEGRLADTADFFSDWPDSYNRGTWYKTWGKAELADPVDLTVSKTRQR